MFHGQEKKIKNIVASALKSCIKLSLKNICFFKKVKKTEKKLYRLGNIFNCVLLYQRHPTAELLYNEFGHKSSDFIFILALFFLSLSDNFVVFSKNNAQFLTTHLKGIESQIKKVIFLNRTTFCSKLSTHTPLRKVVIGWVTCSGPNQDRNSRAQILPFWYSRTFVWHLIKKW